MVLLQHPMHWKGKRKGPLQQQACISSPAQPAIIPTKHPASPQIRRKTIRNSPTNKEFLQTRRKPTATHPQLLPSSFPPPHPSGAQRGHTKTRTWCLQRSAFMPCQICKLFAHLEEIYNMVWAVEAIVVSHIFLVDRALA